MPQAGGISLLKFFSFFLLISDPFHLKFDDVERID